MKSQKRRSPALPLMAAGVMLLLGWAVGKPLLRFAAQPERFRLWVDAQGVFGRLAYMGMVILQVIIALIPGEPFELLGGYAFGAVEGTILCLAAATIGSLIVFFLVRRFGLRLVEVFFCHSSVQSLRFLKNTPQRDFLFLLVFMLPGTPKDLLCYFAGLTDIRLPAWLLICSLGRIPALVTSTVGGDALGAQNYWFAGIVFAVTLTISSLGMLAYRKICRRHQQQEIETNRESGDTP